MIVSKITDDIIKKIEGEWVQVRSRKCNNKACRSIWFMWGLVEWAVQIAHEARK